MYEKILVVDDDPLNLKISEYVLRSSYNVICTKSGAEGLALARSEKPDLLILDLCLPDMDGLEVLRAVREDEGTEKTKVILLVSGGPEERAARQASLGAADIIRKPFSSVEFLARVKHALSTPEKDRILIVNDSRMTLMLASKLLGLQYDVASVDTGEKALEYMRREEASLILMDLNMPDISGLELMRQIRAIPDIAQPPVIFLTSAGDVDAEIAILKAGAADFIQRPFVPEIALCRINHNIELYHYQNSLQREVDRKADELRESNNRAEKLSAQIMLALADAIDAKDAYTNGHSLRVAAYSRELARRMGKSEQEVDEIYSIGLLHDIGKIGIPDEIINKKGKLTDEEYKTIKRHPEIGAKILENITEIPDISIGAHWHHERWDGTGYPDGLKGEQIPETARIIALADAYDTMTSKRCYRDVLPQADVRREIEHGSGTQFDPNMACYMLQMIDEDKDYDMREK